MATSRRTPDVADYLAGRRGGGRVEATSNGDSDSDTDDVDVLRRDVATEDVDPSHRNGMPRVPGRDPIGGSDDDDNDDIVNNNIDDNDDEDDEDVAAAAVQGFYAPIADDADSAAAAAAALVAGGGGTQHGSGTIETVPAGQLVLAVVEGCSVFRIPPRTTSGPLRAHDWDSSWHLWSGIAEVVRHADARAGEIRLVDATTRELFAAAPVAGSHAATAAQTVLEPVSDSSRFFVLRIADPTSLAAAYVGIGFQSRAQAFALNVAVQDLCRMVLPSTSSSTTEVASQSAIRTSGPRTRQHDPRGAMRQPQQQPQTQTVDYTLKAGETISIALSPATFAGRKRNTAPDSSSRTSQRIETSSNIRAPVTSTDSNTKASPIELSAAGVAKILPPPPAANTWTTTSITGNERGSQDAWATFDTPEAKIGLGSSLSLQPNTQTSVETSEKTSNADAIGANSGTSTTGAGTNVPSSWVKF